MRLKLLQFNLQDFFIRLDYPVTRAELRRLTEPEWQYFTSDEVPNKPLFKLFWIAQILEGEAPDVALLNEVGGLQSLRHFVHLFLDDRYEIHYEAGNSNRGIESAFLVRKALPLRAEIRSHRDWPVHFRYPHEVDPEAGRVAVEVAEALRVPEPDRRRLSRDIPELRLFREGSATPSLVILLCHLKSGFDADGLDPGGFARRAGEARALAEILVEARAESGAPVVVAGDLNCTATRGDPSPAMQWLYDATDYEDVLQIVGLPPHDRITHLTYYWKGGHASQYDYILLPGSLHSRVVKPMSYVHRYRYVEDGGEVQLPGSMKDRRGLPSDHYPVVCTLDLVF